MFRITCHCLCNAIFCSQAAFYVTAHFQVGVHYDRSKRSEKERNLVCNVQRRLPVNRTSGMRPSLSFCVLKTGCDCGKYASPSRENAAGTQFYNEVLNREDISRSRRKSRPVYVGETAARLEIYSAMLVTTKLRERTR